MSVQLLEKQDGKVLEVHASGKLTVEDYEKFTPQIDRLIDKHGKIRLLFDMHDFHGWEVGALWEDLKFGWGHFRDIERLAMVGETKWQAGMSTFCKPFTRAEIRYFDRREADKVLPWLQSEMPTAATATTTPAGSQKTAPPSEAATWTGVGVPRQ